MLLQRRVGIAGEIDNAIVPVDAFEAIDGPVAACQESQLARIAGIWRNGEMTVAGFLCGQQDAFIESDKVVGQVDPVVLRLFQRRPDPPRLSIGAVIADLRLVAVDRLEPEAAACPVYPRKIGVRPYTGQAGILAAFQIVDEEFDKRVRRASARIALVDDRGFLGLDVEALDDVDRAFIDLGEGDVALIRAPPIACIAAHLFLRNELGNAIGDRIIRLGVRRDLALLAARKLDHEDRAIAHKAHIIAARRDAGVIFKGFCLSQLAGLRAISAKRDQVKVPAQRHEDRVGRAPVIIHDALAACDPAALTQRLFFFRQLHLFRLQQGGVDQHGLGTRFHIELPEVIAAGIILARLEEGHAAAIGRVFYARWRRPAQRRGGVETFDRQLFGGHSVLSGLGDCGGGEK